MPRTSALDCPGIPPIRALTFDVLGLVKVIEARGASQGSSSIPKIVERWGEPDSSKCVLAASIDDRKFDPLLAVARKNGQIEVLNPLNGEIRAAEVSKADDNDDPITGLHLFKKERLELSTRSCTLLTCTMKGNAILRSIEVSDSLAESKCTDSRKTWNVCKAGNILCSAVDGTEKYAFFGGKGVEINLWDLDTSDKIWSSKSPPKNSLDIFTPTWFTAATFLSKEDHRKIVTGTNSHQVRLYDISAQRRPVFSFDFREASIKSITEDLDGHTIYFGTGAGDLASVDMRTGKVLGCFLGKCSGSIRSIARHPEFPVVASCGLDSYLRFWDIKTRQLLSAVFLKQHLTSVVIDSNFSDKGPASAAADPKPNEVLQMNQNLVEDEDDLVPVKRKKKASREREESKKLKAKKMNQNQGEDVEEDDDDDDLVPLKRKKKASKEREESKKLKAKKMNQNQGEDDDEDDDDDLVPVKRKKASKEREVNKKLKAKKMNQNQVEDDDDGLVHVKRKKASRERKTKS